MVDVAAAAEIFFTLGSKMDAGQLAKDGLLFKGLYDQFIAGKAKPDWAGLAASPDLVAALQAFGRDSIALNEVAANESSLATLRTLIASLAS